MASMVNQNAIGVDSGVNGAIAILTPSNNLRIFDNPFIKSPRQPSIPDAAAMQKILSEFAPCGGLAILEEVHLQPVDASKLRRSEVLIRSSEAFRVLLIANGFRVVELAPVTKEMGYKPRLLRRLFLILYILLEHLNRRTSYRAGKVGRTPKSFFMGLGVSCLPIFTTRNTFKTVHNLRDREFWRVFHNHMNVICFPVKFKYLEVHFPGYLSKRFFNQFQVFASQHGLTILGYADQMSKQRCNAMSFMS